MFVGHRYKLTQTLSWSRSLIILPLIWATVATSLHEFAGLSWLGIPTLPMSLIGIAVAFYLGFKNNSSYDRMWEARKIWGGIVNASRAWAFGVRDLIDPIHGGAADGLDEIRTELVHRHVAWMDALRHQLRKLKSWEHGGPKFERVRKLFPTPEAGEDLPSVLAANLPAGDAERFVGHINPAAQLIAEQSKRLSEIRRDRLLDGFSHMKLQGLLNELIALQGKAERIKNFPFPRQYATVNTIFAVLFAILVPFGLLPEFASVGPHTVWLTVPFSTVVSWVFLTTDRIGEWSENPFEGLANDVPITSMARGIERDMRQTIGETELPPARPLAGNVQF